MSDMLLVNVDPLTAHLAQGGQGQAKPQTSPPVVESSPVVVESTHQVSLMMNNRHGYEGKSDRMWDWRDLQDYVVDSIEKVHGPFPRTAAKEFGIFSGFVSRWGEQSAAIAKYAFETCGGYWVNAPVTVARFTKGNDPFFAEVIAQKL